MYKVLNVSGPRYLLHNCCCMYILSVLHKKILEDIAWIVQWVPFCEAALTFQQHKQQDLGSVLCSAVCPLLYLALFILIHSVMLLIFTVRESLQYSWNKQASYVTLVCVLLSTIIKYLHRPKRYFILQNLTCKQHSFGLGRKHLYLFPH